MIVPFQIPWDPEGLADLERRLTATRWNDAVVSDWSYGMERGFLRDLFAYWRDEYDWAERRAALNRLPHFRTTIDGYGLHFLHYRGRGPNPVPLLLMNGWPSSFVEYQLGFFFGTNGKPAPREVLRNQAHGRIAFANTDLAGASDHRNSIREADRAVTQLIGA